MRDSLVTVRTTRPSVRGHAPVITHRKFTQRERRRYLPETSALDHYCMHPVPLLRSEEAVMTQSTVLVRDREHGGIRRLRLREPVKLRVCRACGRAAVAHDAACAPAA